MSEHEFSINNMDENMKSDFARMIAFQKTNLGKNVKALLDADKIDMAEYLLENPDKKIEIMD